MGTYYLGVLSKEPNRDSIQNCKSNLKVANGIKGQSMNISRQGNRSSAGHANLRLWSIMTVLHMVRLRYSWIRFGPNLYLDEKIFRLHDHLISFSSMHKLSQEETGEEQLSVKTFIDGPLQCSISFFFLSLLRLANTHSHTDRVQ